MSNNLLNYDIRNSMNPVGIEGQEKGKGKKRREGTHFIRFRKKRMMQVMVSVEAKSKISIE